MRRADASALSSAFAHARAQDRAAFVPYVMAGDPDLRTTRAVLDALRDAGVDAIELGVPYGDPLADGPTIAAAAQRALAGGVRLAGVFELTREFCAGGGPPVVLFTYFNPVDRYGLERFAADAAAAGASGAIVPDVALEESEALRAVCAAHGIDVPLLVAPSTPADRAVRIAQASTGFVYVVSRLGVTGVASDPNLARLRTQLAALRAGSDAPLAVGFGVSRAEHVRALAEIADGVIVGSALVDACAGSAGQQAAQRARAFVTPLIAAARRESP